MANTNFPPKPTDAAEAASDAGPSSEWADRPKEPDKPEAGPIGDTGLRQVGEVDLDGEVLAVVEKEDRLLLQEAGVTDATIEELGREFGIADLHELAGALAGVARAVEDAAPSEWVLLWRGQALEASAEEAGKFIRVEALVRRLEEELSAGDLPWPLVALPQIEPLRKALGRYRSRLADYRYGRDKPPAIAPAMHKQREAATHLALVWPYFTGEEPKSHQVKKGRSRPGRPEPEPTQFYKAFARVCDIFGLRRPDPGTVYLWLRKTAKDRAEVWRETDEAIERGLLPKKPAKPKTT